LASGAADEEQALVILLAGGIPVEASSGASGWAGGRFTVWRPRNPACGRGCGGNVGVIAFRWRHPSDADQFSLAVPAYMVAGLLADPVDRRTWNIGDGYAALAKADRASALAFAPSAKLSDSLSRRAARSAAAGGDNGRGAPTRAIGARLGGSAQPGPDATHASHAGL
jgi:hypothetical protein